MELRPINPFPGLRPFRAEERYLFFGREGQSEAVLNRLADTRFVVLVGSSGSGKSSLINAGLLPYVRGGFLATADKLWKVAICTPGVDPIGRLAEALCAPTALGQLHSEHSRQIMEVTLRGSSIGLVDAVRLARLTPHENMLVIIDQFEELFRLANLGNQSSSDDAAAFVRLLLEATRQRAQPIYLVLGMRADYMGDCSRFRDLPEAVMSSAYLIPRMTRAQHREAIEGPVRVAGGAIAPRLVNRLLNEVGESPGQLPILQHVLMRTWEHWQQHRGTKEEIDLDDYLAVGTIAEALSLHADEAYAKLWDEQSRTVARVAFQCLTAKDLSSREARHPVTVATITVVAATDLEIVIRVIDHFREPGRAFLTPVSGLAIDDSSVIDISHESLIRGWNQLQRWVEEEAESAKYYSDLANDAAEYANGKRSFLRDPELQLALDWRDKWKPTESWANRYDPRFATAIEFLNRSREARNALLRKQWLRTKMSLATVGLTACLLTGLGFSTWQTALTADAARRDKLKTKHAYLAQVANEWTRLGNAGASLPLAIEIFLDSKQAGNDLHFPQGELALENALRHLHERFVLAASADGTHTPPDPVLSAAFSKDGRYAITGSADGIARLWNTQNGRPLEIELSTQERSSINDAAFNPDGSQIAVVYDDGSTYFWNALTGKRLQAPLGPAHGAANSVVYSHDGKRIVTAHADGTACVWVVSDYRSICIQVAQAALKIAAFSPDDTQIAAGSMDGSVAILRADTLATVTMNSPIRHDQGVTGIGYTPDGRRIVTSSLDGTWAVWNADTGANLRRIGAATGLNSLAINNDGKSIVTASTDNIAQIWELATGRASNDPFVSEMRASGSEMRRAVFSPDGRRVLTASDDGTARIWILEPEFNSPLMLEGCHCILRAAVFSPDNHLIATASDDHTVRTWNALSGKLINTSSFSTQPVDISFGPHGKLLVSALADGTAAILDTSEGLKRVDTVRATDSGPLNTATFSSDGMKIVFAYENGSAWISDLHGKTSLGPLGLGTRGTRSAVFSRDGSRVLTAHKDGSARLWDATSGALIIETPAVSARALRRASYSPDQSRIVTASADGTARIWDVKSGTLVASYSEGSKILYDAVFSPDGQRLLTTSQDEGVRLSDAATGEPIATPFGPDLDMTAAAFSPDGTRLVTASSDGIGRVWRISKNTEELVNYSKLKAPRCLSSDERKFVVLLPQQQDQWCVDLNKWWLAKPG